MTRMIKYCVNDGEKTNMRAEKNSYCQVIRPIHTEEVSSIWYLVPFFFGLIGGFAAWMINRDRNKEKARNFLLFGFVWQIVEIIVFAILFVMAIELFFYGLALYG
jgi:hypothetical protein